MYPGAIKDTEAVVNKELLYELANKFIVANLFVFCLHTHSMEKREI